MDYFTPEWRLRAHAQDIFNEFPVTSVHVEPQAIEDAGVDNRIEYEVRQGFRLWKDARIAYAHSVVMDLLGADSTEIAGRLGSAISRVASASYWLAKTPWLSDVHFDMDRMGQFRRERLSIQCALRWTGDRYENRCPIAIAHKRFGLSPEIVTSRIECSVCGQDISECPHLPGRKYRVRGGVAGSPTGACRVCGHNSCGHSPDATYITTRMRVVKGGEVRGVTLVETPKQPEARLTAIPVSWAGLRSSPGPFFYSGQRIICDRCVASCQGFAYLPGR